MNSFYLGDRRTGLGHTGIRMLQAAALALILAMVLPARAADERAVKTRVAPVYPEIAKRMRISRAVKMEATVDADGSVKTVSGNHMLAVAAEDAVRHWKFVTGSGNSIVNLEVNFASVP
jgi:hypothetical protein